MSSQNTESIRSLAAEYNRICAIGDAAAYAGLFTEDAVLMPPNAPPVVGRAAVETWAATLFSQMTVQIASQDSEMVFTGEWAFVRGTYSATFTPKAGGAPIEDTGTWLDIMKSQPDGAWKYAWMMWNSDQPPGR